MARKKWPVLPDISQQDVSQAARRLIDHCQAMESHARTSSQLNLHASAVEEFAKAVKKVISDLLDDCTRSGEICNQLPNLYQSLPQAWNEYQEAKTEALPTSGAAPIANPDEIPNQSSPSLSKSSATDNSELEWPTLDPRYDPDNDKRIRIHWDETTPPYRDEPLSRLISEVQEVVYEEGLNVQISRAQKLPSGDIDIYASSREGADILVAYSDRWLRDLPAGQWARVIQGRWSVMVPRVPRSLLSRLSLTNGDAAREIRLQNLQLLDACIPYVWWPMDRTSQISKHESVLIVSFGRPEDANAILNGGVLHLNGTLFKAKKFAIVHEFRQCPQCLRFGHSNRQCTFNTRCRYCAGNHRERHCPNSTRLQCANCRGPHSGISRDCRLRKTAVNRVRQLRKRKSMLYPEKKAERAPAPQAEGQVVPNLAKRPLPPDTTVPAIANSNDCLERPEKRRRPNHANVDDANLPATPRNPLSTLDQQMVNKPPVLGPLQYPPGSEYDFEDDYPSEPEHSETETELDLDISATGDPAQQSTASDSEYTTESSSRGSP
ncbi:hypothetical protein AbraIFM66951_004136 [Aspergillus brasiliensis]|uniref:CCHC-type domain-containing protein n=1 Tax=Aspergillus brasiliensis TaxID=319629 RepID=A0A9W5YTR5_9EURO|nr:hypothetical protein AbraCBS73388_010361 [Aspergillus brasiliensis]GKZ50771.1 hypothetical protein AbraIFM66951_004136 [Aspergillus brasiliensis]